MDFPTSPTSPLKQPVDDFRLEGDSPFFSEQTKEELLRKTEISLTSMGFRDASVKSYLFHIQKFLLWVKKSPEETCKDDIQFYIFNVQRSKGSSYATIAMSAIKFFMKESIGKDFYFLRNPKRGKALPTVLTQEEVKGMIDSTKNLKHKIVLEFLYGCGLRVSEVVKMKIQHIDLKERTVLIKDGKGGKDRYVPIPRFLAYKLEFYLRLSGGNNPYLFSAGRKENYHLTKASAQKIVKKAAKLAGINKSVHAHTLRHSYATHLLDQGTDIRVIQRLLGHSDIRSTEIYTQVSTKLIKNVVSPLDRLEGLGSQAGSGQKVEILPRNMPAEG